MYLPARRIRVLSGRKLDDMQSVRSSCFYEVRCDRVSASTVFFFTRRASALCSFHFHVLSPLPPHKPLHEGGRGRWTFETLHPPPPCGGSWKVDF